jgi:putative nucleotidyltransferase with HDIG domain
MSDIEMLKSEIPGIIPEFDLFNDAAMRDKSLACFASAMLEGGWVCADLAEMPFTLLLNPCPASFLTHTRAVTNTALSIAATLRDMHPDHPKMRADHDTLLAGALLHDVGKLLEYARVDGSWKKSACGRELRHPMSGAALVREAGLPLYIQHIVAAHSWEGDKDRHGIEAIIVHHADFVNFEPWH